MNQNFFKRNREALVKKLQEGSIAILFSGSAPYYSGDGQYPYTPNKNFYYLTGLERENFILQFVKKNGQVKTTLFIERPNPDIEKWTGIKMKRDQAISVSGIEAVEYVEAFETQLNRVLIDGDVDRMYLDIERQAFNSPETYPMAFARTIGSKYAFVDIKTLHKQMAELRVIKSTEEVEALKRANLHTKQGYDAILREIAPGKKEYEMAALFEYKTKCAGSPGLGFPTIAASGANAVILHYVENDCTMQAGDLLLLDFGALEHNYSADVSRTIPVSGKFTDRQKQIYNIVLKAQQAVIDAIEPGIAYSRLNEICKEVLCAECRAIGLIEKDEDLSKYYYHGVGHYLGLDTHDVGSREQKLKAGMVVTVEPGLYIAEEAIGIRIEDDILVTLDGHENLTLDMPKDADEIERVMAGR